MIAIMVTAAPIVLIIIAIVYGNIRRAS